jgi:hypothetical protein
MEKTKKSLSITLDKKITDLLEIKITNKSKYIEWLIYQDMKKNDFGNIDDINI